MLLALDTSTSQVGMALYDGVQVIGEMSWRSRSNHTIEVAPALTALLLRTGNEIDEVKAMSVALGPGSFTSLRVGLSLIKGLAFARHLPIIGIPTFDVLAASQPTSSLPLVAVLQAGRGRVAICWYKAMKGGWQAQGSTNVMTVDELAASIGQPTIVCGELVAEERLRLMRKHKNVILPSPAQCVRRPGIMAELAWKRWHAGKIDGLTSLAPIYLHLAGSIAQ